MNCSGDSPPTSIVADPLGAGRFFFSNTTRCAGVEHLQREALEPFAKIVVGAVENRHPADGPFPADIDFPPRVGRVFAGMSLPVVRILAADVAVDRPSCVSIDGGVLLCRLAAAGKIAGHAPDFDLGESERALFTGQLDPHIAAPQCFASSCGDRRRQRRQQRLDFGIERSASG